MNPPLAASRVAPLALTATEFRDLGHALVEQLATALAAISDGPVTRDLPAQRLREALGLGSPLPEAGVAPGPLLARTTERLFAHSLFNAHPRFFGYITASPAPIGILADLLAAALNPNVGSWTLAPAATEIELEAVRWIAELIGFPTSCGGVLVSGGNMANMVCFAAAREAMTDWDVRAKGLAGGPRLRVYASRETHTWIHKAADLGGLGTDAIHWLAADASGRLDPAELAAAVAADRAAGERPFMVIGTGGSVSTGAVDPLPAIAAFCREQSLWFHVDGAYGGFAAAVSEAPADLRALALADSVAVDPHKWLYMPLEAGCALVRDPAHQRAAFSYHPPYYHFEEEVTNLVDFGPQNSRGFRALKVWLALQHAGASGYRRMISDDIALARLLAEIVAAHPEFELCTQALSITTFRYVPADLRDRAAEPAVEAHLDALNRELLDRSQREGEAFVSNAVIGTRYVLRACIVNFQTQRADIEALPGILARLGREIDERTRPALPR